MYLRDNAFLPRWIAAGGSWLLLQAPALWNGFPLLQYDTGGSLARWYEGTLVPSRAVVYGLMLNAGAPAACQTAPHAARTHWQWCTGARAGHRFRLCRGLRRREASRVDTRRLCTVIRPHAARWHRQKISRRPLPRPKTHALRLQGPAPRRRRRLVLGQPAIRQAWAV